MVLVLLKPFPPLTMFLYPLGFFGAPKLLHGENVVSSSRLWECKLSGTQSKYLQIWGLPPCNCKILELEVASYSNLNNYRGSAVRDIRTPLGRSQSDLMTDQVHRSSSQ